MGRVNNYSTRYVHSCNFGGSKLTTYEEIANATFNYSTLNEIMPMIYKRFTEKSAEEWRQIYKALQLLEYLIKNGSERVIDDARSHLSLLKMLRQFNFIDLNGKDQGINVRNRAKELAELLGDVEKIRGERKKARATRNKYGGVEGGAGLGSGPSSSGRYGGFGSEQPNFGGFSGGVYGDGGGFGGEEVPYEAAETQAHRETFEEYDEGDAGAVSSSSRKKPETSRSTATTSTTKRTAPPKVAEPPKPKKKEPEVDLLGNDDFLPAASNFQPPSSSAPVDDFGTMQSSVAANDEDDFDDFQSAAPAQSTFTASTQPIAPQSVASSSTYAAFSPPFQASTPAGPSNYSNFSPLPAIQTQQQQPMRPANYQAAQPNYYTSVSTAALASGPQPGSGMTSPLGAKPSAVKSSSGSDPFASLMMGVGAKKSTGAAGKGPSMADMAKQKTTASLWGAPASGSQPPRNGGGASGDLLF